MKQFRTVSSTAGILATIGYLIFTLAAYSQYPAAYTPLSHWLSDLGDIRQNPQGAVFYNLGILFTGLLLVLFFLGLSRWKMQDRKIQNWMVKITQFFGILGSLAMLVSALYPINFLEQHRIGSILMYILLGTAFGFSVAALRYQPQIPKWMLALGVVTALGDMLSGVFHEETLLEWSTVALFLVYVFLLGWITRTENLKSPIPDSKIWRSQ